MGMPQRAKLSLAKLPLNNQGKRLNTVRSLSQHHLNESDPASDFDDPMPLRLLAGPGGPEVSGFPPSFRILHPPGTHSVGSLRCSPNESAVRMKRKTTKNSIDSSGNYYRITTKRNCSFESIEKDPPNFAKKSTALSDITNNVTVESTVAGTGTTEKTGLSQS